MERLRIATVWLGGCSGCHMSFLDIDERLLMLAEKVDVVFLDQKLPDGNGIDLCPKILEYSEQAKIIFITGYPNIEQVVGAVKLGAYDYLCKPVELAELEIRVDQALRTLSLENIEDLQRYTTAAERQRCMDVRTHHCVVALPGWYVIHIGDTHTSSPFVCSPRK